MSLLFETRLDGFLALAATACAMMLLVGLACAAWRVARGPTMADRVVALDYLSMLLVALLTLLALAARRDAYLDAALALALVAFLATVAFARFLEHRGPGDGA
jgi:multicomponent Na+:H+ antiporter subunit F